MTTTAARAVQLSPTELLGGWTALNLGEPPSRLWLRPPGSTVEEGRRLLAQAVNGLAGRGLSDGVRPHRGLAAMLRVIGNADHLLDLRFADRRGSGPPILGLGAVTGAHGVIITTYDGDEALAAPLRLQAVDSTRVAATLLDLLGTHGPIRPGIGAPVNIPADALDAARRKVPGNDLWALADQLRELGVPGQEARSLARMCGGPQLIGQLGATARIGGLERRGQWVIGFHSGPTGWFMQLRRGSTITVCPTDAGRLMYQWRELIKTLPGTR
jgi:hypothetical protein